MLRGFWLAAGLVIVGCGGAESPAVSNPSPEPTNEAGASGAPAEVPVTPVCEAGRQVECPCPNGGKGAQACASDGSKWEVCACADVKPPAPEKSPVEACGPSEDLDFSPEQACPPSKPLSWLNCCSARTCLAPYVESGVCEPSPNGAFLVCCPR